MPTTINPSDQTITQYNIQTGGASNLLNNVAPSATSGVPVISQGAASQPVFGTAVVAGGGTGQTTLTNHGVLVGAATSAITQLAAGSAGQVLQSGGASADPSYSTATYPATAGTSGNVLTSNGTNWTSAAPAAGTGVNKVITQVFTGTGTYTPSTGMLYCIIECVGAGGGGGGANTTTSSQVTVGGGGGGGGYARKTVTAATIGVSQSVTIGAAGTAGANTGGTGGTGGTTSVGAIVSATGGLGGVGGATAGAQCLSFGGVGGAGSSGDFNTNGTPGNGGWALISAGVAQIVMTGNGGSSFFGGGAVGRSNTIGNAGITALSYGGGGSGGGNGSNNGQVTGGAGFAGIVVITEFTT